MLHRKIRLATVGPLAIAAILLVVFAIIFVVSARAGAAGVQESLDAASLPIMNTTSKLLFNPLYNLDVTGMNGVLDPYVDGKTVVYAAVYDIKGAQAVEVNKKWAPDPALSRELSAQALSQSQIVKQEVGDYLVLVKSIAVGTVQIGTVEIVFDQASLRASLGRAQTTISVTLLAALIATTFLFFALFQYAVRPLNRLARAAQEIGRRNYSVDIPLEGPEEIGYLSLALSELAGKVREAISTLEERVAERTRGLELAAEVGRSVSQVRGLDDMLNDAAELIREQFDLYYVQVYLANPAQSALVLQSGTGTVGKELLSRGHRLPIDASSLNGRAAIEKQPVVIADTANAASFRPNPLLPDTSSEMAVPLMIGERVVGVLDMQSQLAGALNQEALPAFEALAGQLAIAIQNASLLAETEQSRAEVEAQARRLTRQGWEEYLDAIHKPEQIGYAYEHNQISSLADGDSPLALPKDGSLSAPISITGQALGRLVVEVDDPKKDTKTTELLNSVARQVAQQIENLRLLESAQRYRSEAEQAARRTTREGWKEYMEAGSSESLGYLYDLNEVKRVPSEMQLDEAPMSSLPIKVREETIGRVSVLGMDSADQEGLDLANTIAERLSLHIESLRQYGKTQSALTQSEKLFEASRRLTQAADLQDLVKIAVESLGVSEVDRAILGSLNYSPADELEGMTIVANWSAGSGLQATPIGTHYPKEALKAIALFASEVPLFFNDMLQDERVDEAMREMPRNLHYRSVAAMPLMIGARRDAVLLLEGEKPHNFTQEEIRLFTALAPQLATVLDNRRQFERAQQQAEREAMLNAISQKIQGATTVEAVLQIAARELGRALDAPLTIAQLGMNPKRGDVAGRGNGNGH
jgi:GAF domain-containing protein/HAMP domain-containing protein